MTDGVSAAASAAVVVVPSAVAEMSVNADHCLRTMTS